MAKVKYTKKLVEEMQALVLELHAKRIEERKSIRVVAPLVKAEAATVWRWENKRAIPNQYHAHHIRKWLGYL